MCCSFSAWGDNMTTATTNTIVDHTTDASFRVWVQELITMFVTTLGLTQTGDTGQINTSTVTRPTTNTAAGYIILRFNDTAQSTAPLFMKIEFGTGGAVASPDIWITVGTSSNGSGTINGVTMARVSATPNSNTPTSTTTPYVTRACYNTTLGFFGFVWKNGMFSTQQNGGGWLLWRSSDSTGAGTTDSIQLITNSSGTSGTGNSAGYLQAISFLTGVSYATGNWPNNSCGFWPFATLASTLFSGNGSVGPIFQFTPVFGIANIAAIASVLEIAIGSTAVMTLIGSTSHTYMSVGSAFGGSSFFTQALANGTTGYTIMMLWE